MRSGRILIIMSVFLLALSMVVTGSIPPARAQPQAVSSVYLNPVYSCCVAPGSPLTVGSTFSVDVLLNLPSGQGINGFDVRVNYTNPHTSSGGVLQSLGASLNGNIFSGYQSQTLAYCVDGVARGGSICATDDYPGAGQIHFAEGILQSSVPGPISRGLLFTLTFNVTSYGKSEFLIDRANLLNPRRDPSNPQLLNPEYLPVINGSGVFGNSGMIAFFNYFPADTSVSPAIFPGKPAVFDAGGSFFANDTSITPAWYKWSFGDGTPPQNLTSIINQHIFASPGRYLVSLTVGNGNRVSSAITRPVLVSLALGSLSITTRDFMGTILRGGIVVKMFNTSATVRPFASKTNTLDGLVLFGELSPGDYLVTFSGVGIENSSKTETIVAGVTTQDTVYLKPLPLPADYSGIIFISTILGGVAVALLAIIVKKRNSSRRLARGGARSRGK
jgi:PKD repeat protein